MQCVWCDIQKQAAVAVVYSQPEKRRPSCWCEYRLKGITGKELQIQGQGGTSINVNNAYERFYKVTEPIKNYGSSEKGRKDKVVKYEFNITDEKGLNFAGWVDDMDILKEKATDLY